jgi:transposase
VKHVSGIDREQITLFPDSVDEYISSDNPVRFLDAFVDHLDMASLGFKHASLRETGRPPYHPGDLLKLYLYGYINRIRSSRLLERESKRNLEVMWLLRRLSPDHKTISDFRRCNSQALREVFKQFVLLCKSLSLFNAELVAIDSTKFKAINSRARVKNRDQLEKAITRVEESISHYLEQLEQNDEDEDGDEDESKGSLSKEELQKKIEYLNKRKKRLEAAADEIKSSGDKHISLTDSDSRLMKNEGRIQPSYNVHAAVDSKNSLILGYEISQNAADNNYLSVLAISSKQRLDAEELTVCADAGYYDTTDIKECEDNSITTYVPIPEQKVSKKTGVPQPDFYHDRFLYDGDLDTYCCPAGHAMNYYTTTKKYDGRRVGIYRTAACKNCTLRFSCTTSPRGRYIYRWEHEAVLDRLKQRLKDNPQILKRRKEIIEHIFGTLKKIWGYNSLLVRGLQNISGEVALMSLTYNMRRALSILGTQRLIYHLQEI